ncbi:MAG TPA: hypothetical protein VMA31_16655 [Bryobacteraceae bacterium]|nr:hypothetical protein [Bryobacteraceae bacterium]
MLVRFPGFSGFVCSFVLLLSSSGFSVAQENNSQDAAHARTLAAEHFATERCAVWQKRLNLQDWTISVVVSRASELKPKTLGNIHWDSDKKSAVIRVLDPADYRMTEEAMMKDIEFTVVHELIHLELSPVLSPFHRDEANRREEEHAVNHMAEALLKLDRGQ